MILVAPMDKAVRTRKSNLHELSLSASLVIYSVLVVVVVAFARMLSRFSHRLAAQLEGRNEIRNTALDLAKRRCQKTNCVVFFCSSSGEFEQARPLIDRLERTGNCFTHVFFFSRSGWDYAQARKETMSYSLCPIDTTWNWGWLFSAIRPNCSVVVRHEWWPAFLATAHAWNPVWLIDAVDTTKDYGKRKSFELPLRQWARKRLARFFDRIYVVDAEDLDAFTKELGRPAPVTAAIGDTKYDRVIERATIQKSESAKLSEQVRRAIPGRYLIAGSIYQEDLDVLLPTFSDSEALHADWVLVLAPHHPKAEVIDSIARQCARSHIEILTLSSLSAPQNPLRSNRRALIVDTMGQLAELYSIGDLAYIGGAMHAKIHNVLEPAAHGLALASGPFYKNSREAIRLQQAGILTVVEDKAQLTSWWTQSASHGSEISRVVRTKVSELCGASNILFSAMQELLNRNARISRNA